MILLPSVPPRRLHLAAGFFLLTFLAPLAHASADASHFEGAWRIDMAKPFGVAVHTYLSLHQDGTRIGGRVFPNNSVEIPIRDAHMDGPEMVFSIDWNWTFHVRPDGANLHVLIAYGGGGSQESTAHRVPESEIGLPALLPVPVIHPLPDNGLARTPPMGWNSWNHFAEAVDDKVVRETADAMVSSGMAEAGYVYINIDDTWEAGRDPQGNIVSNGKFPDMKALADYVHGKGLKLGIYSSPGPVTCGGYEGTYGHEEQDARTFARWGIDYLKYDWCSAGRLYRDADLQPVYQKMGEALRACGRPIVYSLCEYGTGDVWTWGPAVGGNLWRTTGDIQDNWKSMSGIGFEQGRLAPYAGPGHWNDPDMLEVGNGGMTAAEYRTHFSLWCLLAAPLMAGNDLRSMSPETRDILANRDVIAVDQDPLGRQGARLSAKDGVEIWTKPLQGGGVAVGVFNRNAEERDTRFAWTDVGAAKQPRAVRDLWRHADVSTTDGEFSGQVPAHGVVMLLVR